MAFHLARDLPRTGNKTCACGVPGTIQVAWSCPEGVGAWLVPRSAGNRQQTLCMRSTRHNQVTWFCPEGVGARLPAICREPAAKPVHSEYQAQSSRLVLPGRRRSAACPAICREPAAKPCALGVPGTIKSPFLPGRRTSVACPAICREPAANPVHSEYQAQSSRLILPGRRRSALARDLPGTGSKPCALGVPDTIESPGPARKA